MYCGTPVIAVNTGGPLETVKQGEVQLELFWKISQISFISFSGPQMFLIILLFRRLMFQVRPGSCVIHFLGTLVELWGGNLQIISNNFVNCC